MTGQKFSNPKRKLYRDIENAKVAGVCAGLATYFGFNLKIIRLIWLFSLIFFWPAALYILLAIFIPKMPENLFSSPEQRDFYQGVNRDPKQTFGNLKLRFRDLDLRLQLMEKHVTSKTFDFDRELQS